MITGYITIPKKIRYVAILNFLLRALKKIPEKNLDKKGNFLYLPGFFRKKKFSEMFFSLGFTFTGRKKVVLENFFTLGNLKKFKKNVISGYVPKMALAIYMRGDKKSWKKKEMSSMKNWTNNISFDSDPRENIVLLVYMVFKTLLSTIIK